MRISGEFRRALDLDTSWPTFIELCVLPEAYWVGPKLYWSLFISPFTSRPKGWRILQRIFRIRCIWKVSKGPVMPNWHKPGP